LIELSQNIVGSGVLRHRLSSRYCCYGNDAAGSKPIKILFNLVNWEFMSY